MPERPDALALLEAARESIGSELLPGAKPEQKRPLLMVAKALAIAVRELGARDSGPDTVERRVLERVLGGAPGAAHTMRERVRARLRSGCFDAAADADLRAGLLAVTRARLAVSNPRLLAALDDLYLADSDDDTRPGVTR